MHLDSRIKALAGTASLVVLLAAIAAGGSASAASKSARGCTGSKNSEAIIDNSGSMASSDPDNFRAKFMNDYIQIGGNQGKMLGAVLFNGTGSLLFGPQTINGANIPTMQADFNGITNTDGTDYDSGFSLGNTSNPAATSRIFLTDGQALPPTQHVNPKIKTYVIGLGNIASDPSAQALLSSIASDTGGPPPFLITDASQLQPVAGAITSDQNCKQLTTYTDAFTSASQSFVHKFKAKGKSADIFTSWPTTGDTIDITVIGNGHEYREATVSKVKTRKTSGATFVSAHVKGLTKGQKVKLKVRATTLPAPTTATTQVIR